MDTERETLIASSSTKSWLPLLVIVVLFMAATKILRPAAVAAVQCASEAAEETVDVVMLSASWCRYCRAARNFFVANNVNYCEWDIELSTRGAALYERSAHKGIPIIYLGDEVIVGFDHDQLSRSLASSDLLPSAQP
ncbi:MAG: glutaredoxin domain-containing protein [Proteobacteria bacterium]|nr:glutaredoxin domain-containing protein [Pseudomonadota bacterium]